MHVFCYLPLIAWSDLCKHCLFLVCSFFRRLVAGNGISSLLLFPFPFKLKLVTEFVLWLFAMTLFNCMVKKFSIFFTVRHLLCMYNGFPIVLQSYHVLALLFRRRQGENAFFPVNQDQAKSTCKQAISEFLRLVLKQTHKRTRNWPIRLQDYHRHVLPLEVHPLFPAVKSCVLLQALIGW